MMTYTVTIIAGKQKLSAAYSGEEIDRVIMFLFALYGKTARINIHRETFDEETVTAQVKIIKPKKQS